MLRLILAPIIEPLASIPEREIFCDAEWQRLDRISHPKRLAEYIAGHKLLRLAASIYTADFQLAPETIEWNQPEASAPRLRHHPGIRTGISHSQGWVLIALGQAAQVDLRLGIDLELNRPRKNLEQLAKYSFGEQWLKDHQDNLVDAFFLRWTQCESVVKASDKTLGTQLLNHQQFSTTDRTGLAGQSGRVTYQGLPDFTLSTAGITDTDTQLGILDPVTNRLSLTTIDWHQWWAPV